MNVKLRYKDCFLFKMRHTELHSKVTILCQSITIGPGVKFAFCSKCVILNFTARWQSCVSQ